MADLRTCWESVGSLFSLIPIVDHHSFVISSRAIYILNASNLMRVTIMQNLKGLVRVVQQLR